MQRLAGEREKKSPALETPGDCQIKGKLRIGNFPIREVTKKIGNRRLLTGPGRSSKQIDDCPTSKVSRNKPQATRPQALPPDSAKAIR